jgi:hypothetical protein
MMMDALQFVSTDPLDTDDIELTPDELNETVAAAKEAKRLRLVNALHAISSTPVAARPLAIAHEGNATGIVSPAHSPAQRPPLDTASFANARATRPRVGVAFCDLENTSVSPESQFDRWLRRPT